MILTASSIPILSWASTVAAPIWGVREIFSLFSISVEGLGSPTKTSSAAKLTLLELSSYIKEEVNNYALNVDREQTPQLQGDENRVLVEFNWQIESIE